MYGTTVLVLVNMLTTFFLSFPGVNTISRYLGSRDPAYHSLFVHDSWRELVEAAGESGRSGQEVVARIDKYLRHSSSSSYVTESAAPSGLVVGLPVAEAMVTYKERR